MEKEGMTVFLYIPKGSDDQKLHNLDEIYIIISGSGKFFDGTSIYSFSQGDVLHVPAGVEHRFEEFTKDFKTWVVFYGNGK